MADELISRQAAIFKLEERFDFHRERSQRNIGSGFVEVHKEWAAMAMGVAECLDVVRKLPAVNAVVLPCKEGDTVYEVGVNTDACTHCRHHSSWFGSDEICDNPAVEEREYPRYTEEPICDKQFWEVVEYTPKLETIFNYRDKFGKTIFLTREEAEAALPKERVDT